MLSSAARRLARRGGRLGPLALLRPFQSSAELLKAAEPEPVPLSKLKDQFLNATSSTYLEELEERYRSNPKSVDKSWASFFHSMGEQPSLGAPHTCRGTARPWVCPARGGAGRRRQGRVAAGLTSAPLLTHRAASQRQAGVGANQTTLGAWGRGTGGGRAKLSCPTASTGGHAAAGQQLAAAAAAGGSSGSRGCSASFDRHWIAARSAAYQEESGLFGQLSGRAEGSTTQHSPWWQARQAGSAQPWSTPSARPSTVAVGRRAGAAVAATADLLGAMPA